MTAAKVLPFPPQPHPFPEKLARRGYHVAWRPGEVNHCPGCGRSNWYVGRSTAECGFCETALPIEREVPRA